VKYFVRKDGAEEVFDVEWQGDMLRISRGSTSYLVDVSRNSHKPYVHLLIDGRSYLLSTAIDGELVEVEALEGSYRFEVVNEKKQELERLGLRKKREIRKKDIHSPMPGLVVAVEVEVGQRVRKGQGVAIVEAMKMENEMRAAEDGIVKEILVKKGQKVNQNQLMVVIE
jgi:pyruvate carboxylase subunit B